MAKKIEEENIDLEAEVQDEPEKKKEKKKKSKEERMQDRTNTLWVLLAMVCISILFYVSYLWTNRDQIMIGQEMKSDIKTLDAKPAVKNDSWFLKGEKKL